MNIMYSKPYNGKNMKYLLMLCSLIILVSCTKEDQPLFWQEIPSEFWYFYDDGITTITYGNNPIKSFVNKPRMLSVQTTFAAEISIGHLYADGKNTIFLAKNGLIYKEYEVPHFTSAEVINNTLFLYRNGDEVYNTNL